jgi:thiol-disulfide isomerase/thioredoxin
MPTTINLKIAVEPTLPTFPSLSAKARALAPNAKNKPRKSIITASRQMFYGLITLFLSIISQSIHAEAILYPLHSKPISFSSLKGKWIFINYWASWCDICVQEIPELNRFYKQHKKDNVALFAVNYDMLPEHLQQELMTHYQIDYPALIKDPAASLALGDIRGVPVTFVYNPEGQLSTTLYGGQTAKGLNQVIQKRS